MKNKQPLFKFGGLHIHNLDRTQRKTLEFWMAFIRTIVPIVTCGIVLYQLLGR